MSEEKTTLEISKFTRKKAKAEYTKERFEKDVLRGAMLPDIETLFQYKIGERVKIRNLGIFTEEPQEPIFRKNLFEVENYEPVQNELHFNAPVDLANVKKVMKRIINDGIMHTPICTVTIEDDPNGTYQITSGRHRVCALGLLYGLDAEITVYHEDFIPRDVAIARVPCANDGRTTKTLEKAFHDLISGTHGELQSKTDEEKFNSTVSNKSTAISFALQKIFNDEDYEFEFSVGEKSKGATCTTGSIKSYLMTSIDYSKGMTYKQYKKELDDAVDFINAYVLELTDCVEYDTYKNAIMASKPLGGLGLYLQHLKDLGESHLDNKCIERLVEAVIVEADANASFATTQSKEVKKLILKRLQS